MNHIFLTTCTYNGHLSTTIPVGFFLHGRRALQYISMPSLDLEYIPKKAVSALRTEMSSWMSMNQSNAVVPGRILSMNEICYIDLMPRIYQRKVVEIFYIKNFKFQDTKTHISVII